MLSKELKRIVSDMQNVRAKQHNRYGTRAEDVNRMKRISSEVDLWRRKIPTLEQQAEWISDEEIKNKMLNMLNSIYVDIEDLQKYLKSMR